ncbi:acetyl-CoA carboxylase biotin carboxyl carrier protein [Micromonospora krabiensis]|uniref:Biotin carboxyl carrier protein of acetyl-CoA carboxylase n=1 Tax=Micromonospora krabiensis TaxID=307121 RepID=A0A1C3MZR5_9ACTN|nr:acetyl-CoA carboxylase biotin carboxyl carrier protein [Micromonospora krabiensis]SBV25822.1 acetyl-CoA carboxylase biotin carboxyl carrier protein [Micromonospora krabiensis]
MTRGPARSDVAPVPAEPATGGPDGTDAVLAGLRRHAQHLVAELAGPVRRVRLRSGETVLEVEWHGSVALPPAAPTTVAEAPAVARPAPPPAADEPDADPHATVRAPIVGTFYRAPEPGAAPYVAVGDLVRPGQVVGIVEAMKLMNEVTADRGGRVAAVLAEDGQPVEYDQPLLALDPA